MKILYKDIMKNAATRNILSLGLALLLPSFAVAEGVPVDESHGVQLIELEGGRNFRDLGGYEAADGRRVKPGLLFRSGVLSGLTAGDYEIISRLDIETIVDFRTPTERYSEPTFWQAGPVEVMSWDYDMGLGGEFMQPFMNPSLDLAGAEAVMASHYPGILEQQNPSYRAMFSALVEEEAPLLFHCSAGKDRTGIAAALILTALGVDHETVVADYIASEKVLGDSLLTEASSSAADQYNLGALPAPAIEALMGTRRSYIEAVFKTMVEQSGSVDAYLRDELGLSAQDLAALRNHYLH